ncbi:uncharacterized protein LOC125240293 isoform X2 [Leguminivora glycinivorella]|uniref:uncharacterized protein LOC125240293 isoform X2 n=1 Tax=Leguminivora glycinivorella TaxID=1035111 RepID=UPI00200E548C|nr:uncharacterized protein LOC125240293 isoform X2 [Leguminivora glycinivorella]
MDNVITLSDSPEFESQYLSDEHRYLFLNLCVIGQSETFITNNWLLASSGRRQSSDDDRKPGVDDDMCSEGSAPATEGKLSTEELLAEAAMRSALAAEKQAEAVAQGVELLRDLVAILRERPLAAPSLPPEHLMHHHHRL